MVDIPDIQLELARPACCIAPINLCKASDAWEHVVTSHLFHRIARQIFHQKWTGTDKAHFATEHVDQLWQFIEAGASKKFAKPAESLRIRQQTPGGIPCVAHGAEFVDGERSPTQTRTLLLEKNRCADG